MKVLVTGASGFLGKECVKQFLDAGDQVITTDKIGNVDIVGDLSDHNFVANLPNVDVVINCAAVQYVTKNIPFFNRNQFFEKNNVLAAANVSHRYGDGKCHFVHVGTSMMYKQGGHQDYTTDSPMLGDGVYSESKLRAQVYINTIPNVATVIPCIIGGEGREGLFRGFINSIKKFRLVVFPGKGEHKINMIHVSDVASLILKVSKVRASGFFNAAAHEPLSIRQWVDEICDELAVSQVTQIPVPLLPVKILVWLSRYRILAREQLLMLEMPHVLCIKESLAIGWTPRFTNAQIARDIAKYIDKQ